MIGDAVTLDADGRPLAVGDDVTLDVPTAYLDNRRGRVVAVGRSDRAGRFAVVDVVGLAEPVRLPGYQLRKAVTP